MTQSLLQKTNWRAILRQLELIDTHDVNHYAEELVNLANTSQLSENDIINLALHLGIKVFPRNRIFRNYLGQSKRIVAGLPDHWIPKLSEMYFSIAYENPDDPLESINVVPAGSGSLPHIIHQTSDGYIDPNWFNEIVPLLYTLSLDDKVERKIGKQFKNQKLTLGQVNTINHFFKRDPILNIEGLCTKCYQVSLPKKGFGVKFYFNGTITDIPPQGIIQEVRFSARKPMSTGPTSQPYVTELVVAGPGMLVEDDTGNLTSLKINKNVWTMLDEKSGKYGFSTYERRAETHIDAALYDFDKLTMRLPVCLCSQ